MSVGQVLAENANVVEVGTRRYRSAYDQVRACGDSLGGIEMNLLTNLLRSASRMDPSFQSMGWDTQWGTGSPIK